MGRTSAQEPETMRGAFRSNPNGGFTLLEVVETLGILVVGIMALSGSMISANRCQSFSKDRLAVARALSSELEMIVETPFDKIQTTYNNLEFEVPGVSRSESLHPAGSVKVVSLSADQLEVTVTGEWRGISGKESFQLVQRVSQ
jgi:hypothetical protein